jgi:ABC-type phosphate transport system auxiliary subunit
MRIKRPLGNDDFILVAILYAIVIIGFLGLTLFWANSIVNAAYNASQFVTKGQVQKAEELGAIQRTELEVVNNYGEQDTYNPQIVGENK